MKTIILTFTLIIAFNLIAYAQFDVKSKTQILEGIEWLTNNPVDETDSLFTVIVLDNALYQMVTYPRFPMHIGALSEFMGHDMNYKYLDEVNMIFVANMLAQKIETDNSFNLKVASIKSMKKVITYYKLLIEKNPDESNQVLDEYCAFTEEEFEKKIKKLAKK